MCQHVFLEVAFLCAFVFTLLAVERLFSAMNKHVSFEVTSSCGGELTLHASERLLT